MISKIDVNKFGLFNDYQWKPNIGNNPENVFKTVNIIYGRNYSGKTTLSRIFRCIEKGGLHENYLDGVFTITTDDNTTVNQLNLVEGKAQIKLRVYNTDFVKENLGWLHNVDGTIEPFTILGEPNVELDKKIKALKEILGDVEQKTGLLFAHKESEDKYNAELKVFNSGSTSLESKLKTKANDGIKVDSNLFISSATKKTYQTNDLKNDIETISNSTSSFVLTEQQTEELKALLKEQPIDNISPITESKPNFPTHLAKTNELLIRKIVPSKPISDLINDVLLQDWVRQGIGKHKGKRDTCGFCGNILPFDLWDKLDAHFNKESEDLRTEIAKQIEVLEKAKEGISDFLKINVNSFYSSLHPKYNLLSDSWIDLKEKYENNIQALISKLEEREKDIFNEKSLGQITDVSEDIFELLKKFNLLIEENNNKTNSLSTDHQKARTALRLSNISQFIDAIDYNTKVKDLASLEAKVKNLEQDKKDRQTEIDTLTEEKRALEANAKDESKGAELVNRHLERFFGHDELKLVPDGEAPNMKFKIIRSGDNAKNLSEGECSLISFCYFIARLEDEMNDQANNKKLIIYVDDPISSLDGNHIFFMFSLIESIIAKPKKYGQLFISTHNLDFLKYLKRITTPEGKENINHFLIERKQKQNEKRSFLSPMPNHIRDYVTEFNYLFGEIYSVYKEVNGDRKMKLENTYNQFYNLPNNLRKFLECYLFYRFPNSDDPLKNLHKLFDNNIPSLINRVINEYSHLTYIDRGWKPIDVDEAEECAKIIIEKIKNKDIDQFNALVASLN